MGKVVWLLWELSQLSTAVPAALPYKDMLPVLRLGNAKRPGWVNRWWYLQVQCLETKKGSKRFNSKEWRLCFAHLALINLYGSMFHKDPDILCSCRVHGQLVFGTKILPFLLCAYSNITTCFSPGLGIRASVFWANRSFFVNKWVNERFAPKNERFSNSLIFGERPERFPHIAYQKKGTSE